MGYQLSWLECMPDKHEVPGSIPGYPKEPFEKKVYKVH